MAWAQYIPMAIELGMGIFDMFGHKSNSALASYNYSKKLQEHQYDLNRQTRQTAFQDTRQSLEGAGYNPLLAVGQQSQGGTFGASMSVQDPKTENLQNRLATLSGFTQAKLNSANAYNQIQQGNLTTAQASNLLSQASLNSAQTGLTNLQQDKQIIENSYLPEQIKSEIKYKIGMTEAATVQSDAAMINARANERSSQANYINAQTNSAVGQSTAWRNYNSSLGYSTHGQIGPVSWSHTGNPNAYTEMRSGHWETRYETINGRRVPVKTYVKGK